MAIRNYPRWRPAANLHVSLFDVTGNSAIRSADPENPTLQQNMKCIGSPVAEIWPFAYLGAYGDPHFGGRGGRRGSAMAPLERAMVVSYRLPLIDRCARPPICNHSAVICDRICLRRANQQGVGHFRPKFPVVPPGVDPWCLCLQRANNGEIIFEEFQPM